MFEKEEQQLKQLKQRVDEQSLPLAEADEAIRKGIERAKQEKQQLHRRHKRIISSVAVVALLFITLITSIRVSPAFANTVASIPGLEKFVDLIAKDKGLDAVFKNDYYQEVNEKQTVGDLHLTVDGVIMDESGINVFYTIDSKSSLKGLLIKEAYVDMNDEVPLGSISYGSPLDENEEYQYSDRIDYHFKKSHIWKDQSFILQVVANVKGNTVKFSVPFTVPKQSNSSKVYSLNEHVEIEGQTFKVEEIRVAPLRTSVKITLDPSNTMKILNFEDMRLEDEKGEVWSSIRNGTTAMSGEDGGETFYLQSNYFEQPEKLYLRINKVQAVKQEEVIAKINTETGQWLNQPTDKKIQIVESTTYHTEFIMPDAKENTFTYQFIGAGIDAKGNEVDIPSVSMYTDEEGKHWDVNFSPINHANPIEMELHAYPNYLEGDITIELE
ncbi:DUF4179 domain-containing protein [Sporosarcina sp. PTS2304]|uniref:DUF4179 domain-containing protein n=1 Tax=Sporosarcina sp. PTS2304 TaxID=2283194 RepID=UPI000E0CFB58|nr:DUF4179 domain-containing protein [Sporosarcina sp. PTS2304]AXI00604.1 DUF4179 domain-containing protein [Sporosarcina sp. PTS2304]